MRLNLYDILNDFYCKVKADIERKVDEETIHILITDTEREIEKYVAQEELERRF